MSLRAAIEHAWYGGGLLALLLSPLSLVYCAVMRLRRAAYRSGLFTRERMPVPVIVVGNLTVGGSGKTPVVIWVVEWLRARGMRPGVVSRGYGGRAQSWPQLVDGGSDPVLVGDEPVLIASRCGVPVAVGPDRPAAARLLLTRFGCDVLVSDDGLQHYRLDRDIEIAVVDGARRFGNGRCLPAGPLREPLSRLGEVALKVANGAARGDEFAMQLQPGPAAPVAGGGGRALSEFALAGGVHAVAGIGHPGRFFAMLRAAGVNAIEHPFPDHHHFDPLDMAFDDGLPVMMTEKDAVKCRRFSQPGLWFIPVRAELPDGFGDRLAALIEEVRNG